MRFLKNDRPSAAPPVRPAALIEPLEGRRLLSTTVAYAYDADQPDAAEAADGVAAEWSGHTLTLSGLPAHQMVHVDADFAGEAGESATVIAAGRVSDHALGAGGEVASTGTDGWIADGDGTLTVAVGGDADLSALTVRLHASELAVHAQEDAPAGGEIEVLVTRSTPETIDPADASEPMPAVSIALTTGGTATAGEDYDHVENELEMGEGDAEATLLINPRNPDGSVEEEGETIDLELNLEEDVASETITLVQGRPDAIGHDGNNRGSSPANPMSTLTPPATKYEYKFVKATRGGFETQVGTGDFNFTSANITPPRAGAMPAGSFTVTTSAISGGNTQFTITPNVALVGGDVYAITVTIKGTQPPLTITIWITG